MLNISFMYDFKACTILYQDRVLKVCIKILLNFKSILSLGKNVKVGKSSKSLNFCNLFGLVYMYYMNGCSLVYKENILLFCTKFY